MLLMGYVPLNPWEERVKAQTLAFLQQYPQSFTRQHLPGHFTSSALILNPTLTHILLIHHKKLDLWLQPGGHCEPSEVLEATARREALEEVGLACLKNVSPAPFDIDIHTVPAWGPEPAHTHFDVRFLFLADSDTLPKANSEAWAVQWAPFESLASVNVNKEDSWQRLSPKLQAWARTYRSHLASIS